MSNINIDNINRLIEKHKSLYRDMLKKHYHPLLRKFIEELMQELNIKEYSSIVLDDEAVYLHLKILSSDFQITKPEEPYGNAKYALSENGWELFSYIKNGLYEKEKNQCQKQKIK